MCVRSKIQFFVEPIIHVTCCICAPCNSHTSSDGDPPHNNRHATTEQRQPTTSHECHYTHTDTLAPPHAAHTRFLCSDDSTPTLWQVTRGLHRNYLDYLLCMIWIFRPNIECVKNHTLWHSGQVRVVWTKRESTGRVVIVIVITRIVEILKRERESASQSKRKGVTKQHVTQISQRTKYHSTPHHSTQHITHKHTTHTSHWVLTETDRNEKR